VRKKYFDFSSQEDLLLCSRQARSEKSDTIHTLVFVIVLLRQAQYYQEHSS
jgi:hypothetical protein